MAEQDEISFLVLNLWKNNSGIYRFVEEVLVKLFRSVGHSQQRGDARHQRKELRWPHMGHWFLSLRLVQLQQGTLLLTHGKSKMKPWTRRYLCPWPASAVIHGAMLGRSIPVPRFPHLPVQPSVLLEHVAFWWTS